MDVMSLCPGFPKQLLAVTFKKKENEKLRREQKTIGFKGKVLRECVAQLAHIFTQLFQVFLNTSFVPQVC